MNKNFVLAGLLGAIGMFVWTSVAHMALPLGQAGVSEIPNEQALLSSMSTTLGGTPGFYMFPALGAGSMDDYAKKLISNPSGLMMYHPAGTTQALPRMLVVEFLTELALSFIAVYLLSRARIASYGGRVTFVAVIGFLAALSTNVSYWNWYGFPISYTLSYMFTQVVGFVVAGLIAARFVRPQNRGLSAAAA